MVFAVFGVIPKRLVKRLGAIHADHHRIARGAFRVAVFLLLGKFAGALKEMAVAYRYGISDVVDAYQFTMVMANWLPVTLVGALSVVLIPVLVRSRHQPEEQRKQFLGELLTSTILLGVVLGGVLWWAWPWVVKVMGTGLNASTQAMSKELIHAFAPAALFTLLIGVSAARLRARERHINTLLDSVPAFSILIWVLLAPPDAMAGPLLWGTVLGYAVQCVWLYILAQRADQIAVRPQWGWQAEQWPALMQAATIMLIGQVAMSFVGPVDQYAAAQLGGNANATFGYANRFISLMLGVGAASVGRAALPVLADIISKGDVQRARSMALRWSLLMVLAGLVVALVAWVLAPWGIALLYERGAFSAADTAKVATVLRWGVMQLPFYFGVLVLVQLLASQQRYRLMASIAVLNFVVKALLTLTLAPRLGVQGIMLATSLMYTTSFICYFLAASRPLKPATN